MESIISKMLPVGGTGCEERKLLNWKQFHVVERLTFTSEERPEIKKCDSEKTLDRQMHVVDGMTIMWKTMRIVPETAV